MRTSLDIAPNRYNCFKELCNDCMDGGDGNGKVRGFATPMTNSCKTT
jgi:hypothetical protein